MPFATFDPAETPPGKLYRLLISLVVPRPIALVSTESEDGRPNLAPFSYFQLGGVNPPSIVFSPTLDRESRPKDTLANIEGTGEFVVNLVTRSMAEEANLTSAALGRGESEWGLTGFSPLASVAVRPARVAQSPAQFECKLHEIVRHGNGPGSANYVIGEVVCVHCDESLCEEAGAPPMALRAVGRLGGSLYIDTGLPEIFSMKRPKAGNPRP